MIKLRRVNIYEHRFYELWVIDFDVFKFVEMDTQLVEVEDGMTENESVTRSVRSAIEASVYELIVQGSKRGFWKIASSNDLDNKEETVNENVE